MIKCEYCGKMESSGSYCPQCGQNKCLDCYGNILNIHCRDCREEEAAMRANLEALKKGGA